MDVRANTENLKLALKWIFFWFSSHPQFRIFWFVYFAAGTLLQRRWIVCLSNRVLSTVYPCFYYQIASSASVANNLDTHYKKTGGIVCFLKVFYFPARGRGRVKPIDFLIPGRAFYSDLVFRVEKTESFLCFSPLRKPRPYWDRISSAWLCSAVRTASIAPPTRYRTLFAVKPKDGFI